MAETRDLEVHLASCAECAGELARYRDLFAAMGSLRYDLEDLPSGFTVTPGTATIAAVTQTQVKETAVGLHGGVDVRYLILENVGAGLFLRYAQGRVNSDVVEGGRMEVGGFQYGVGARVRF